jgi:hypothetical protein
LLLDGSDHNTSSSSSLASPPSNRAISMSRSTHLEPQPHPRLMFSQSGPSAPHPSRHLPYPNNKLPSSLDQENQPPWIWYDASHHLSRRPSWNCEPARQVREDRPGHYPQSRQDLRSGLPATRLDGFEHIDRPTSQGTSHHYLPSKSTPV